MTISVALALAGTTETVDINANETIVENVSDDPRGCRRVGVSKAADQFARQWAERDQAITMKSPGVVADSNGILSPAGRPRSNAVQCRHRYRPAEQSIFQQLPLTLQSLEVITGATPAEYGDKTSLVVNAITRSGLIKGGRRAAFSIGPSFGTVQDEADIAYGAKVGNFTAFNFDRSNRFLDAPELPSFTTEEARRACSTG